MEINELITWLRSEAEFFLNKANEPFRFNAESYIKRYGTREM